MAYNNGYPRQEVIYHASCHSCSRSIYDCEHCWCKTRSPYDNNLCNYSYGLKSSEETIVKSNGKYRGFSSYGTHYSLDDKQPKLKMENQIESFDELIMECSDAAGIESKIKESYEKWLKKSKSFQINISYDDISVLAISPVAMFVALKYMEGIVSYLLFPISLSIFLGWVTWISIRTIKEHFNKKNNKMITESDKLLYLKTAYTETIKKINSRLDSTKDRIEKQIRLHNDDLEKLRQYEHLFGDTTAIKEKITNAIIELNKSFHRISMQKSDINKLLDEYTGTNGYLSKKEKEIQDLKNAQELSDRMAKNFQTTLEITKNVDVLVDVIIPGVKRLMEFKIPQLIEDVNYQCDREQAYLQIKG